MAYKRPIDVPCPQCSSTAGEPCWGDTRAMDVYHSARIDAAFETFIPRCVDCGKVAHPDKFCGDA